MFTTQVTGLEAESPGLVFFITTMTFGIHNTTIVSSKPILLSDFQRTAEQATFKTASPVLKKKSPNPPSRHLLTRAYAAVTILALELSDKTAASWIDSNEIASLV